MWPLNQDDITSVMTGLLDRTVTSLHIRHKRATYSIMMTALQYMVIDSIQHNPS